MSLVASKIEELLTDENVSALICELGLVPMPILTPSFIGIIRSEYLEKTFNQLRVEEEREELYAFLEYFVRRGRSSLARVELSGVLFPTH